MLRPCLAFCEDEMGRFDSWLKMVAINMFGVKGYGEAEFAFSLIKVIAVIGFM